MRVAAMKKEPILQQEIAYAATAVNGTTKIKLESESRNRTGVKLSLPKEKI